MGHRTLSWRLVLRALFLDNSAYDELRDDDNPFVEGVFLIVLIGAGTAILNLIGQALMWASTPSMDSIKQLVWSALQRTPSLGSLLSIPQFRDMFLVWYDRGWQVFPALFGAPDPVRAAVNILAWPLLALLGWLIYGLLAHGFSLLLGGRGSLNQMLGASALAATPLLLRGLGIIPFLAVGGVVTTWQLICRFRAIRSVHGLSWPRAFWATVLPLLVYLIVWVLLAVVAVAWISALARG